MMIGMFTRYKPGVNGNSTYVQYQYHLSRVDIHIAQNIRLICQCNITSHYRMLCDIYLPINVRR